MIAADFTAPSYIHGQKPNKAIVPAVLPDCSYNLSLSGMWIVSEYPGDVSELRNENAAKS